MGEKTYKVQEIFKWFDNFDDTDIHIKGETKEFDIELRNKYLPHLLGLQYINPNNNGIKVRGLYSYVRDNYLSDQEILTRVEKYYGIGKRENVENRINSLPNFLKNMENGIITEKTFKSEMGVNYLIIQSSEGNFYHLGILSSSNGAMLVDFETIEDTREKDLLKTYFVENDRDYFKDSKIFELINSIEKYDEKSKKYIPFSFDEEKNKKLLEEYYSKTKEKEKTINNYNKKYPDRKDFLEEYLRLKGVNIDKLFRCFAKEHEDNHPSMNFYKKGNICKCFSCGEKYNIYKLVGQEYGLNTFKEQAQKVEELYNNRDLIKDINNIYEQKGVFVDLDYSKSESKNTTDEKQKYSDELLYCQDAWHRIHETDYLLKRGISEEVIKSNGIGYDPAYKIGNNTIEALIIPTSMETYTIRNIDENSNFRYKKVGELAIYNYWKLKEGEYKKDNVYIVEGEIDALSLETIGKNAIALGSVNNIDKFIKNLIRDRPENTFYLMLDNDEAGKKAQEKLYQKLIDNNFSVINTNILEKYKDVNEFLVKDKENLISKLNLIENEKENMNKNIETKEIKKEEVKNMTLEEKIYGYISDRISQNNKEVAYTVINENKMMEDLKINNKEFSDGLGTLFYSSKIFLHTEKEDKINNHDGSISQEKKKVRAFRDEKAFREFSNDWKEKEKSRIEKRNNDYNIEIAEKNEKVKGLSENAKKIYEEVNKAYSDGKVFRKINDLRKEIGLEFKDMQSANKELTTNKISYTRPISYKDKETGEIKNDWIITNSKRIIAILTEKEKVKEEMFGNKENIFTNQKVKSQVNER